MAKQVSDPDADMIEIKAILHRLEPVISRLAVDVERHGDQLQKVTLDVRMLSENLAELKGRVSQLPTTMAIFTYMAGLVALSAALFRMGLTVLKYPGTDCG